MTLQRRLILPRPIRLGAAGAYLLGLTAWAYIFFDTPGGYLGDPLFTPLIALGSVTLGWICADWRAMGVPGRAIPLTVPAGYADGGEAPVWFFVAVFVAPACAALIGLGVAFGRAKIR